MRPNGADQHKDVQGVAVFAEGRRNKAEVEGKCHSFGQETGKHKEAGIGIIIKLVAAALRRFYDGPAGALL